MDLFEAIRTRRSVAQLSEEEVPRDLIEQMLEAAVWAPNHKRVEPWRFAVFTGASREKLAAAYRENYRLDHPDASEVELAGPGDKSAKRVLQAPVTIVVSSEAGATEIETQENYAATVIATEHILLAAHALGLGTCWRSGEAVYTKPRNAIKELIALPPESQLVAVLPIGFPAAEPRESRRASFKEKTRWFE